MNILIVSQNFYPDNFAINEITEGLVRRGHKVTVLTGLPDYTTSFIPDEYKHGKNRKQSLFGADIIRVPTIARRHGPIWRSLNYLSFVFTGLLKTGNISKRIDFDVIYVWQVSPVTMAIPAIALKRKTGKPLFLYCLDLWPESVKAMGFKEGSFLYGIIHGISRWIYSQCDHIAVSSKPFIDYLNRVNNVPVEKISYLPQFAPADFLKRDLRKKPNGHIDFLYVGNIGKAQDMPCLIDAISQFKEREDITFHIVGGGSEYEKTVSLAKETGADKVSRFYGPMKKELTLELYAKADACVMTLDGSNHIGDTLPGKLQTYMAAGKTIIGAMNGAGKDVIEESGCGICVPSGDAKALKEALLDFIDNYDRFSECGQRGRNYFIKNFTEERHFIALKGIMEHIKGVNDETSSD